MAAAVRKRTGVRLRCRRPPMAASGQFVQRARRQFHYPIARRAFGMAFVAASRRALLSEQGAPIPRCCASSGEISLTAIGTDRSNDSPNSRSRGELFRDALTIRCAARQRRRIQLQAVCGSGCISRVIHSETYLINRLRRLARPRRNFRFTRHSGGTARNVAKSPDVCPRMFARGLGYSYRSATMGSTRMARRAGM
jgi:hypothetical protein